MSMHVNANAIGSVRVSRFALIEALKANRAKHIEEYADAMIEYKELFLKELKTNLKNAKAGKDLEKCRYVSLTAPRNYSEEYDEAIAKFEFSVDDNIILSDEEFNNFVRNKWNWTATVSASNSVYASSYRSKRG